MKRRNTHLLTQHDMEGEGIPAAHVQGIDLDYRAPDLTSEQRALLPKPVLDGRPELLELYWRTWAVGFDRVRRPDPETGFKPFCDAAFSEHIFQWDTCFLTGFLRHATHALPVYETLDNFYAKQHADGFICREISSVTGEDFWPEDHPSAINPPLFADSEWGLFQTTGDEERLVRVFPALEKYYGWLQAHRRHADGVGYWTTALASGMDNTPRAFLFGGGDAHDGYGHSWVCMTAQQALSARRLAQMAAVLGRMDEAERYSREKAGLLDYLDACCWNDALGFYVDVDPEGEPTDVLTPAGLWPVLAGAGTPERWRRVFRVLEDPDHFWRPHAMTSVSAEHPTYHPRGNYWQGSVWPPMVMLGLRAAQAVGEERFAQALAHNHLENLLSVYRDTGTLWENYAPESAQRGNISRPEFVGWTGCGPIEGLIEVVIGLRPGGAESLRWVSERTDRHGVTNLRYRGRTLSLVMEAGRTRISYRVVGEPIRVLVSHAGRSVEHLLPSGEGTVELE